MFPLCPYIDVLSGFLLVSYAVFIHYAFIPPSLIFMIISTTYTHTTPVLTLLHASVIYIVYVMFFHTL
jgi:hypothetical protein